MPTIMRNAKNISNPNVGVSQNIQKLKDTCKPDTKAKSSKTNSTEQKTNVTNVTYKKRVIEKQPSKNVDRVLRSKVISSLRSPKSDDENLKKPKKVIILDSENSDTLQETDENLEFPKSEQLIADIRNAEETLNSEIYTASHRQSCLCDRTLCRCQSCLNGFNTQIDFSRTLQDELVLHDKVRLLEQQEQILNSMTAIQRATKDKKNIEISKEDLKTNSDKKSLTSEANEGTSDLEQLISEMLKRIFNKKQSLLENIVKDLFDNKKSKFEKNQKTVADSQCQTTGPFRFENSNNKNYSNSGDSVPSSTISSVAPNSDQKESLKNNNVDKVVNQKKDENDRRFFRFRHTRHRSSCTKNSKNIQKTNYVDVVSSSIENSSGTTVGTSAGKKLSINGTPDDNHQYCKAVQVVVNVKSQKCDHQNIPPVKVHKTYQNFLECNKNKNLNPDWRKIFNSEDRLTESSYLSPPQSESVKYVQTIESGTESTTTDDNFTKFLESESSKRVDNEKLKNYISKLLAMRRESIDQLDVSACSTPSIKIRTFNGDLKHFRRPENLQIDSAASKQILNHVCNVGGKFLEMDNLNGRRDLSNLQSGIFEEEKLNNDRNDDLKTLEAEFESIWTRNFKGSDANGDFPDMKDLINMGLIDKPFKYARDDIQTPVKADIEKLLDLSETVYNHNNTTCNESENLPPVRKNTLPSNVKNLPLKSPSTAELEQLIRQLGLSWMSTTLHKTEEASALYSSSSGDQSSNYPDRRCTMKNNPKITSSNFKAIMENLSSSDKFTPVFNFFKHNEGHISSIGSIISDHDLESVVSSSDLDHTV